MLQETKLNIVKWAFRIFSIVTIMAIGIQLDAQKGLKKLLPDHLKFQYAGGIGFLSIGAGYASRDQKLEGDIFYGYLPQRIGGIRIHSLSGKFNWIPFHLTTKTKFKLEPLTAGFVINYNFGDQYFAFDPPNYSYKYYSFPTAINSAIFVGSRITPPKPKRLSLYYEILCFDRDIISMVDNPQSLHAFDIVTLSLGIRIHVK